MNTEVSHAIKYGIVCDDIRQELNGKFIIIGVYGTDIGLPVFPATIPLRFLIAIEGADAASFHFETKLVDTGEEILASVAGEVFFPKKGLALVPLPPVVITLKEPTELTFSGRVSDGEWVELWNGPVVPMGTDQTAVNG